MTGKEARDDEREALAGTIRSATEEYFREDIPEDGRDETDTIVDALIAAGYRKHPAPEWEYGAGYEADNGREVLWFSLGGGAFTVREAAENEVTRYDDPQIRLIRRTRPGPWVPVGEGEQG